MFKLVVLSALLAVAAAAPSGIIAAAPVAYSSAIVGSVPTSISHQSSSIVHSHAIAAPVVHAAPIAYAAAPVAYSGHIVAAHAAPIVTAHHAPIISAHSIW